MNEFPRVRISLLEQTVYWGLHKDDDGNRWAKPGTDPFDAYWHHIVFYHRLPKSARYWGYGYTCYDCQEFEHFGFWWFNVSWSTPGSYARAKKREERELAANDTPTP